MSADEVEVFEEEIFADDEFFFAVVDADNVIADLYVRGLLPADEVVRYERMFTQFPERRSKIANASVLREFVNEERKVVEESRTSTVWDKVASIFKSPSLSFAMTAAVVLLLIASAFLFVRDRQAAYELARVREQQTRAADLERELEAMREREAELQRSVDDEREASADYADELERERARRTEVESELEKLKNEPPPPTQGPMIASIALGPIGTRGGPSGLAANLKLNASTKRIAMRIALPDFVKETERLSVSLNQKSVASGITPRRMNGALNLNVTLPVQVFQNGRNELKVSDADGKEIGKYGLIVSQNKQ